MNGQQQQQQQPTPTINSTTFPLARCAICGTTRQLLRCAKCKTIFYCSTEHQHMDWPIHKQKCRLLAKQKCTKMQQLQQAVAATTLNNVAGPQQQPTMNVASTFESINQFNNGYDGARNRGSSVDNSSGSVSIYNLLNNDMKSATTLTANGQQQFVTGLQPQQQQQQQERHQPMDQSTMQYEPQQQQQQEQDQQMQNSVILGTNENEIMNTQAEIVVHNSNCDYFDNIAAANSTTMEQMQFHSGVDDSDSGGPNCFANIDQSQLMLGQSTSLEMYEQVEMQPKQTDQQQFMEHQQQQQQQQPNHIRHRQQQQQQQSMQQFLQWSNTQNNQYEKSSSYQIGSSGIESNTAIGGNANERRYEELCRNIINDMNQYGLSVVDDFLGREKGIQILNEVHQMYNAGVFQDGQLVNKQKSEQDLRTIRGDKITWVKGVEPGCSNVGYLINQIDAVIFRANTMKDNGKLGNYNIKERTKAMVACYPGSGARYVMHIDNPNKDGRVITAIYYLNLDWDTKLNGGVLRIFPEHGNTVAEIEPKFDRLIFFWSDKRNPHEVQPAHRTRYAITVWYFDANEREAALNRCKNTKNNANLMTNANTSSSSSSSSSSEARTSNRKEDQPYTNANLPNKIVRNNGAPAVMMSNGSVAGASSTAASAVNANTSTETTTTTSSKLCT